MGGLAGLAVGITLLVLSNSDDAKAQPKVTFNPDFKFGAASASYQIEGAWDKDYKSENIWDTITHKDWGYTADRSNGDVAANSYEFWQKDIDALDNIGVSS